MKKLILILTLIFALALCFVACEDLGDNSKEGQSINALSGGAPETEEPTTEAPTTEKPASEEPTSEEPTSEEPTTEESTSEEPTTEELTSEEPTTKEPTTEEPMSEAPTTEVPTTDEPATEIKVVDEMDSQLNQIFAQIQEGVDEKSKFEFYLIFQDLHYELKNSGKYDHDKWTNSSYSVRIYYDASLATEAEWYKNSQEKDDRSLRDAFYNEFSSTFENSIRHSGMIGEEGIGFTYNTNEGFLEDFNNIKLLFDLSYITKITIIYEYSLPHSFMNEEMGGG